VINIRFTLLTFALSAAAFGTAYPARADRGEARPYGLAKRQATTPYLRMPQLASGTIPLLLSQTGAFRDTRNLVPNNGLIPYDLVVPFWSDGAQKMRWVAIPKGKIRYSPTGDWAFPRGTVFVKTFELPTDAADLNIKRRLETRLLVCDSAGGVYGVVYKWRPDNSDADLLTSSATEAIPIKTAAGGRRDQTWYFPSRPDCLACHNAKTSGVLGVKARQMNRPFTYASGVTDNEIRAWNHVGLFEPAVDEAGLAALPTLAPADDAARSLKDRARSYLDANCAQCHRPGGTVAYFDARYDTPLTNQNIIGVPAVKGNLGYDNVDIVTPNDIWRSSLYDRIDVVNPATQMPPLARNLIDTNAVQVMADWINSLGGTPTATVFI